MKQIERGDIVYVDLGQHSNSSIQSGFRPCVVVGGYPTSPVVNICPLTSRLSKKNIPVHVTLEKKDVSGFLEKTSIVLVEQITTMDKRRIVSKTGHIPEDSEVMNLIDAALKRQVICNKG